MSLDQLYQKVILEHNKDPHNYGPLDHATHRGQAHDALCGDDLQMALVIEGGVVTEAMFDGQACAVTKASASLLTDWLIGRPVHELASDFEAFKAMLADPTQRPVAHLGLLNQLQPVGAFPARRGNACLPWIATLRALG